MKSLFCILVFLLFTAYVLGNDEFDVLRIADVPFPYYSDFAAVINATHTQKISEFTVCYRFLLTSYNSFWATTISAPNDGSRYGYLETIGFDTGYENEGYQAIMYILYRNVTGGGIGNRGHPVVHHTNLPRNVQTSKWVNSCTSYSSLLQKLHLYHDGLKAFSYHYKDKQDNALPANMFEITKIGANLRGMITDLNIYSTHFEEENMVAWTTKCQHQPGDIFSWDVNKLILTPKQETELTVALVKMNKKDVCPDPSVATVMQEPSKLGGSREATRYKPKHDGSSSFVGKVLELISDPYSSSPLQLKDRCLRLAGAILTVPQNEIEEQLMDKTIWDYLVKKSSNNITLLEKISAKIQVGGETSSVIEKGFQNVQASINSREGLYPDGGYYEFYHPVTDERIKPSKLLVPSHNTFTKLVQICISCVTGDGIYREPTKPCFKLWGCGSGASCFQKSCVSQAVGDGMICVFNKDPSFNLRGLCSEAVMDTQYKFAEHAPPTSGDNTRRYVGPKGWMISRNAVNKAWQMNHTHYPELTLTMMDTDALPVGRHTWKIENNACNQGETSSQVLLMSACQESEFTCDDGKCVNITQRCNNIEVNNLIPISK